MPLSALDACADQQESVGPLLPLSQPSPQMALYLPAIHHVHDSPNYVAGITNTIARAELAAIAASILQGHSYIATDSLSSLHQIRKQILYPELHCQHVQGHILRKSYSSCATHLPLYIPKS
eukprot:1138661-Pelagomonas_calceolata.AAC.3